MTDTLQPTDLTVDAIFRIGYEHPVWSTEPLEKITLQNIGIKDDRHSGIFRTRQRFESNELSGMHVANDRQISIVSSNDMIKVAESLDLPLDTIEERSETSIDKFIACQLAANILLKGEVSLNEVAQPGVLMVMRNEQGVGPVVRLTEYNNPCKKPVVKLVHSLKEIDIRLEQDFDTLKTQFKAAAASRRGWVGSVYSPGTLFLGANVAVHYPVALPE